MRSVVRESVCDAGFERERAAARVGHADAGELLDRIYDKGDRRKRSGVREAVLQVGSVL